MGEQQHTGHGAFFVFVDDAFLQQSPQRLSQIHVLLVLRELFPFAQQHLHPLIQCEISQRHVGRHDIIHKGGNWSLLVRHCFRHLFRDETGRASGAGDRSGGTEDGRRKSEHFF